MTDDPELADDSHLLTNFDRLQNHLEEGGLAHRLLGAFRQAQEGGNDPAQALRGVVASLLAAIKEANARCNHQEA